MAEPKFDPDAFLAQHEASQSQSQGFDPDAFLAQHEKEGPINPPGTPLIAKPFRYYEAYGQKPILAGIQSLEKGGGFLEGAKAQFGKNPDTGPNVSDITPKIPDKYNVNLQPAFDLMSKASPMVRFGMEARKALGQKNDVQGLVDQTAGMATDPLTIAGLGIPAIGKSTGLLGKLGKTGGVAAEAGSAVGGAEPPLAPGISESASAATQQAPKSIQELHSLVGKAGENGELNPPRLDAIQNATKNVPDMKYPLMEVQKNALSDPAEWSKYRVRVDNPLDKEGQLYSKYEQLQKNDFKNKLDETLMSHAKREPISDPVEAGSHAIGTIIKKTDASDSQLIPILDQIRNQPAVPGRYTEDLVSRIKEKLPGVEFKESETSIPGLETDPDAGTIPKYSMAPYSARKTGMTQGQYNMIKNHFEDLANSSYTPSDIQNIRSSIKKTIVPDSASSSDLKRFNSALLDHMEHVAANENPELAGKIRSTFNGYRQNRQNMEDLGKTVAFRNIENPEKLATDFPPETALPRMFKDSATVGRMKVLLGEDFPAVASDYLNHLKNKATDIKGFSSNKFGSLLEKNAVPLQKAFEDNPEVLDRVKSLTDLMRVVPDTAPINPPNTANVKNMLEKGSGLLNKAVEFYDRPGGTTLKYLKEGGKKILEKRNAAKEAQGFLTGKDK